MSDTITLKDKRQALKLAYQIVTDNRNSNRYACTALFRKDSAEMFTYPDMLRVLNGMYKELEAAPEKPMQKPLTHKEAEELLQSGVRVWVEECGYWEEPEGVNSGWLEEEVYGTEWRCWASRPTVEERNAAPWEE